MQSSSRFVRRQKDKTAVQNERIISGPLCSRANGGKRYYNLFFAFLIVSLSKVFVTNNQLRFRMKTFSIVWWKRYVAEAQTKWNWKRFTKWTSNFLHYISYLWRHMYPHQALHKPVLTTGRHCVNHTLFLYQNNQTNKTDKKEKLKVLRHSNPFIVAKMIISTIIFILQLLS